MRRLAILLVFAFAAVSLLAFRPATTNDVKGVEGVWKAVHATDTNSEGTREIEITTPNLLIFTGGHYANLFVRGDVPRELLPQDPTDEQLLAAWRRFRGNAGTYDIMGNEITTKVIVAKSPNWTAEQGQDTSTFELDGDTMYRTWSNPDGTSLWRVEHVRVE